MKVTIKDIAREAGVDRSTVSRALSGYPFVKEETRRRVQEVAAQLGYKPNAIAQSLSKSKSNTMGVVFHDAKRGYMNHIIEGITDAAADLGYDILLSVSNGSIDREAKAINRFIERRVDGVIAFIVDRKRGEDPRYEAFDELHRHGIPIVLIDRYIPERSFDYVVFDNFRGAYLATKHLIELGHRRIAFFAVTVNCTAVIDRIEGYKRALSDSGIPVDNELIIYVDAIGNREEGVKKGIEEIVQMKPRPTAILGTTERFHVFALQKLRELGFGVPQDFSIVGFAHADDVDLFEVPLTAVHHPHVELGREAVRLLARKINDPQSKVGSIIMPAELVVRRSTAPPVTGQG